MTVDQMQFNALCTHTVKLLESKIDLMDDDDVYCDQGN